MINYQYNQTDFTAAVILCNAELKKAIGAKVPIYL